MNTEPVTVVITCTIDPDQLAVARQELAAVIEIVRTQEPACRGIRIHDDPRHPNRLLIIEHWESEETFSGPHMQTPHMQAFLQRAETFLDGAAEFRFWREILSR